MVEYSNKLASPSELGNYTEEGFQFEDVYKDPNVAYDQMQQAGVNTDNMTRLDNINKKTIANNPRLVREKQLKKLFIQYVRKYISNPTKYLQYPKQIKNLPSWFDEALGLFRETEISRDQKRMLREYFYGLLKYRDDKLAMSNTGIVNPDEVNRQLGERSPYSMNEDNLDTLQLPRQRDLRNIDVNELMRNNREMNVQQTQQGVPFENYGTPNAEEQMAPVNYPRKGKASLGSLGINAVRPSNVEDYVSFGKKQQPTQTQVNPSARPHSLMGFMRSTPAAPSSVSVPVQQSQPRKLMAPNIPTRKGMGTNLTSYIIGGNKPTIAPVARQQPGYIDENQQPRQPPAWLRASKKSKVRIVRKSNRPVVKKSKPLFDMQKSTKTVSDMFTNIKGMAKAQKPRTVGKVNLKMGNVPKATSKQMSGLESVRNLDRIFSQVKVESNKNFGKENMKMPIIGSIKDQCSRAFSKNKFKQEAINMRKNFFSDVKASYPVMKSEIKEMGNIHESEMMKSSTRDMPDMINSFKTSRSVSVKRGSMRPEAVGIMDFDFSIEPLNKNRKKKIQLYDEDDFINRNNE